MSSEMKRFGNKGATRFALPVFGRDYPLVPRCDERASWAGHIERFSVNGQRCRNGVATAADERSTRAQALEGLFRRSRNSRRVQGGSWSAG